MDDSVAALHDVLMRLAQAESLMDMLRAEWVALSHDEKIRLGDVAPTLVDVIIRIAP